MRLRVCAALAAALATTCTARGANLQQLVQETQRVSVENGQITMVWWIPQQFWDASLSASGVMSPTGKAQVLQALQDYMIFGLVHAKSGIGGITDASSKEDLLLNTTLEIGGQTVQPLAPESLSPAAAAILGGFKPGLERTMGQFGASMQILIYPALRAGKPLIDPSAAGTFRFTLYGQTFTWHLPLASLLPPKFDRGTHEQFPGNYDFNPYTGAKLSAQP